MIVCSVLRRYLNHGFWPFLRALVRFSTAPLSRVAAYAPKDGWLADIGCGQGHFLEYCRRAGFRQLLGVEPSSRATRRARGVLPESIAVIRGNAAELCLRSCNTLVVMDVLYLMSPEEQISFIRHAASIIEPEGVILLKTMDSTRRIRQLFNVIQEFIAVRLFGITLGSAFHFRTPAEWISILEQQGLEAHSIPMWKWYIHPHVLIIGRRNR